MSSRTAGLLAATLALVALAGCGEADTPLSEASTPPAASTLPATTLPAGEATAVATTEPSTTTTALPTTTALSTTTATIAATTIPATTTGEEMLVLTPEGLGVVDFGAPRAEAAALFEQLIGSPPTDVGAEAGWVEYVGWNDIGLYLGFSRPSWSEHDGVDRLVGWAYRDGHPDWDLRTPSGIGVGSTLDEIRELHGHDLALPDEPDECGSLPGFRLRGEEEQILVRFDGDTVAALEAGLGVGC